MDTCKEQVSQHDIRGPPGTCQHVQGKEQLRLFPSVLFYESIKFPDIRADYFHFPVGLSDHA